MKVTLRGASPFTLVLLHCKYKFDARKENNKDAWRCKIMLLASPHRVTHITDFLAHLDPIQSTRPELCFKVARPETLMLVFLNLISRKTVGRSCMHMLREDLQKIAIVIAINQNLQFLQLCQVLFNLQSYLNHHFLLEKF